MTKFEIASAVQKALPALTKTEANAAINAAINAIADALVAGENVYLRGFATFAVHQTKMRLATDFRHGNSQMILAPSRTVKMKTSRNLKQRLNP